MSHKSKLLQQAVEVLTWCDAWEGETAPYQMNIPVQNAPFGHEISLKHVYLSVIHGNQKKMSSLFKYSLYFSNFFYFLSILFDFANEWDWDGIVKFLTLLSKNMNFMQKKARRTSFFFVLSIHYFLTLLSFQFRNPTQSCFKLFRFLTFRLLYFISTYFLLL